MARTAEVRAAAARDSVAGRTGYLTVGAGLQRLEPADQGLQGWDCRDWDQELQEVGAVARDWDCGDWDCMDCDGARAPGTETAGTATRDWDQD